MPTPIEIIIEELDNQVGLYNGKDKHSGVGIVTDMSAREDASRVFCGFSKVHRYKSDMSKASKDASRLEWKECAEDIIRELALYEYEYELYSLSYNYFELIEGSYGRSN